MVDEKGRFIGLGCGLNQGLSFVLQVTKLLRTTIRVAFYYVLEASLLEVEEK